MRKLTRQISGVVFIMSSLFCSLTSAININLQYPPGFLFSAMHDAAAKDAIDAAAADISAAITNSLSAVNTDVFTGITGGTTVSFDWSYQYTNPANGAQVTINVPTIAANTVTMYVGTRNLFGSTLGEGGPAVAGYSLNYGYNGTGAFQLATATASAESQSELALKRGGGPVLGTYADTITLGPQSASFSIDFGITYGSLALDWTGSGDGNWHFNHTTSVAAGKNDLYSVALHEMLHALGIGASDSWDSKVSGANWSGTNVTMLMGSGVGLIEPDPDGSHIAENTMSTHYLTGAEQEAVMDPNITTGTRKSLTALDLAFLRDLGYNTVNWVTTNFSPADFNEDGDVDSGDLLTWQNAYGLNANGDTDNDADSDGRDFLFWQREYTGPLPFTASVSVPEPSAFLLVLASGMTLLGYGRHTR